MQRKIITKRIVSPDGKVIAEVTSEVLTSEHGQSYSQQSINVQVSSNGTSVSGFSHASASSANSDSDS
jgi:Fibrinogen alpha C domain